MRSISRRRLVQAVAAMLQDQPRERKRTLRMLAAYLIEHKQQNKVDLVLLDLARELRVSADHLYAEVSSAFPLDSPSRLALTHYLRSATGAKTVELDEQSNADLLAGLVVTTADAELDTSAARKLQRLRSLHLSTPEKA